MAKPNIHTPNGDDEVELSTEERRAIGKAARERAMRRSLKINKVSTETTNIQVESAHQIAAALHSSDKSDIHPNAEVIDSNEVLNKVPFILREEYEEETRKRIYVCMDYLEDNQESDVETKKEKRLGIAIEMNMLIILHMQRKLTLPVFLEAAEQDPDLRNVPHEFLESEYDDLLGVLIGTNHITSTSY